MKVSFLVVLLALCLIGQTTLGQSTKYKRPYKVWVSRLDTNNKLEGYLIQAKDSSVVISRTPAHKASIAPPQEIAISTIKHLKFRKKGKVGLSVLQGALVGLATTQAISIATADPFVAAAGIIFYMPVTAAIGGIIGRMKVKVPINGNQMQYQQSREKLAKYTSQGIQKVSQPLEASTSNL